MIFNSHSRLADQHAFLSASQGAWANYTQEKLDERFATHKAAQLGTALHEFAHLAVGLGIKLPKSPKTLNRYINDTIGYQMVTEQILYYSDNCFGTADAIKFSNNLLRIHDLKNGRRLVTMRQLEIYAALFCLEYEQAPEEIGIELRIYQNDDVEIYFPDPERIRSLMSKIIMSDKRLEELKAAL